MKNKTQIQSKTSYLKYEEEKKHVVRSLIDGYRYYQRKNASQRDPDPYLLNTSLLDFTNLPNIVHHF